MNEIELRDNPDYIRQLLARRSCGVFFHENPNEREKYLINYNRLYAEHFLTPEITIEMNQDQYDEFCLVGEALCSSTNPYGDEKKLGFRFAELSDSFYELIAIYRQNEMNYQGLYSLLGVVKVVEMLLDSQERILNTSLSYPRLCISEQVKEFRTGLKSIVYAYYNYGDIAIQEISDFITLDKVLEALAIINNPTVNGQKCVCFFNTTEPTE